jgi:aldehyde dehydrogenase (NAD+)
MRVQVFSPMKEAPEVRTALLIGGEWRTTSDSIDVCRPDTGEVIARVASAGPIDVEDAISAAREAQGPWGAQEPRKRGIALLELSRLIRRDKHRLAAIESVDTGKPLSQAMTDVEVSAQYFEFYGGLADKIYGDSIPFGSPTFGVTFLEALGVTAHIVPWNYPIQISARTTAPSLVVGNACVLKPAEEAPLSALELGALALEAGVPPGLFNVIPGLGEEAGAALAQSDEVDHISFTGGLETGRLVMAAASRNVKPVTMELGGKSPNIVFSDADLDFAIPVIVRSVIQNAGQTCSAGARLIVEDTITEEVQARLVDALARVRIGPGLADPDLGPLISNAQAERVGGHVARARADGARVLVGGSRAAPTGCEGGYFFQPTLIAGVRPDAAIAREEVFGPVLVSQCFEEESEALHVANDSEFGLVAGVWTKDVDRAIRMARALKCGQVYINGYGAGGGVALPFGGIKKSGFGREKGVAAIHEYTQSKSVLFDPRP